MNRALLTLVAFAGLAAGILHYTQRRRTRRAPATGADDAILQAMREVLPPSIDARVRDGVVALRGNCSTADRDRLLTHALSIPGVRRVYSDLEDNNRILETGATQVPFSR